jgi:hydrogenase nickel incorporation protein HypA/HybF
MHEMGLAESALEIVLEAASGVRVTRIRVRVGKCLLVVPDSFQFSFELASAGTEAESAKVEIQETPATVHCRACEKHSELNAAPFLCSNCSSPDIDVVAGEDMVLDEIELDDGTVFRNRNVNAAETLAAHFKEFGLHEH